MHPLVVAVLVAALSSGCAFPSGDAASDGGGEWPPSVPEVEVTMRDFALELDTPVVPDGRVVFRVHNAGSVPHRVTLVPLPEDLPPIDEQLQSNNRRSVDPVGAINPRKPGGGSVFAVELERGRRYALVCFEKDDNGVVHARKGGNAEFRAGGPHGTPSEPAE